MSEDNYLSPAFIVPLGGGGLGRRRRRFRGRRGRGRVFYASKEQLDGDEYDSEEQFSDAGSDYYDSDYDDDQVSYEEFDSDGEEYFDDAFNVTENMQPQHVEGEPADEKQSKTAQFLFQIMESNGMIGHENPDDHPASKGILPLKSEGDCDRDVVVLDCVVVDPDQGDCYEEVIHEEPQCPEPKDPCQEKEPKKQEDCYCPEDNDDNYEDDEISLDNTIYYDCWVEKGAKTHKKQEKPHPDDCDERQDMMDACSPAGHVKKSLNAAMVAGAPFKSNLKTKFQAANSEGKIVTQKVDMQVLGKFKDGAYKLGVNLAPLNDEGKPIEELRAAATLVKVQLDKDGKFLPRGIKKGMQSLQKKKVAASAIQHAMMVLQDLV